MIPVLDVGESQGMITLAHWRAIATSGVRGIVARCGNGNNPADLTFARNRDGARGVSIGVGPYHVGFPLNPDGIHSGRNAATQALMHYNACAGLGSEDGEIRPVLDLEWPMPVDWPKWKLTASSVRGWTFDWGHASAKLYGRKPILYLYPDFDLHLLAGASAVELQAFTDLFDLWLARYEVAAPGTVAPWSAPILWQKSDGGGRLPSFAKVDEDVFLGDDDAWTAFLTSEGSNAG